MKLTLTLSKPNRITFVVIENEWRSYRGRKRVFIHDHAFPGQAEPQTLSLRVADFKDANGDSPANWRQLDQFGICARYEDRNARPSAAPPQWQGDLPTFHRLEWERP